jgi:hypothetical protein
MHGMLLGQGSPRGSHPWGATMLAPDEVAAMVQLHRLGWGTKRIAQAHRHPRPARQCAGRGRQARAELGRGAGLSGRARDCPQEPALGAIGGFYGQGSASANCPNIGVQLKARLARSRTSATVGIFYIVRHDREG